jgi:outer membrane lipoprotein
MRMRMALGVTLAIVLAGCASVVPGELQRVADRSLTLAEVRNRPGRYVDRTVVLGGEVLHVTPKQGQTEVEVLERPLGGQDRPRVTDESGGRFLLLMEGFLDPAVYRAGREITVVGQVQGLTERPIGEVTYTFPILRGRYLYLWPERQQVVYQPLWPDPFWSDHWWFWHHHRFGRSRFHH